MTEVSNDDTADEADRAGAGDRDTDRPRRRSGHASPDAQRLPDAELEVLAYVQKRNGATAKEVREGMAAWRPLAHSSVMTLLGRLEDRGLVQRERTGVGREYRFLPATSREEAVRPILGHLVRRVFGGDAAGLVASLYGGRKPTEAELDRLEALVEELKARGSD